MDLTSLAEFEYELPRQMVHSGIAAAAEARSQTSGRPKGPRPSDRYTPEVFRLSDEKGLSQRAIVARLGVSKKNTMNSILRRRAAKLARWAASWEQT